MKIILANNLEISGMPEELRRTLMERLRFPNPKWLENDRMGRWNKGVPRELRFYGTEGGDGLRIPRGYIRHLILLCRKLGIPHDIDDRRRMLDEIDFTFHGELKPFQREAASRMLAKEFGTLNAPTGSGKTVIALHMIATRRQPALIIVHTKDLAHQWVDRIGQFLGISPEDVGLIGAGKKTVGREVSVALVQTLCKCAEEIAPKIGYLIVDECHRTPSRTFTDAVTHFDSRYMLGLSATPWRRDKLSKLIFWHLGDVHHEVDKECLIETGDVLRVEVIVRETDFEPYFDPANDYSKMLSELTADDDRNRLIAADVAREAEKGESVCLVLSDRKKHCETIRMILRYKHDIRADLLTGDLTTHRRREVLDKLNNGRVRVLVATGQLVGEGFDCKDLSTLFITTPIRFSGRVIQYIGRVLRPAPGKDKARVFDYVDVKVDPLVRAAEARQRVYHGMGN